MNTNFNANTEVIEKLIEKLNVILNAEQEKYNDLYEVPHGEAEQKVFSAGYAEGIADVLYILENELDPYEPEEGEWKTIDPEAWWDDAEWEASN